MNNPYFENIDYKSMYDKISVYRFADFGHDGRWSEDITCIDCGWGVCSTPNCGKRKVNASWRRRREEALHREKINLLRSNIEKWLREKRDELYEANPDNYNELNLMLKEEHQRRLDLLEESFEVEAKKKSCCGCECGR